MDHIKDLQEVAIRTLASRGLIRGSRRVLSNVLKKFPERKSDVDSAIQSLSRGRTNGAANRSQPVGSQTNRTSVTAGPVADLRVGRRRLETF